MFYTFKMGGTGVSGLKFDDNLNVIQKFTYLYNSSDDDYHVDFKHALVFIKKTLLSKEARSEEICLGIALPGVINNIDLRVETESVLINTDIDIKKYFAGIKNIKKIVMENDGKACIVGEKYYGDFDSVKNMFMLSIGSVVGGASIINGELHNGIKKYAGEYSKMFVDIENKTNFDSAAIYIGILQIRYRYAIKNNINFHDISIEDLVEKFNEKDEVLLEILDKWLCSLAKFIININLVLDTELVLINGHAILFPQFVEELNKKVVYHAKKLQLKEPKIVKASLDNKSAFYGLLHYLKN